MKINKTASLLIILAIYIAALVAGYFFAYIFNVHILLKLFLMDAFATVIVYIASVVFKNTSFYDPYWSFVPWVLVIVVMIMYKTFTVPLLFMLVAFSFWSWRLTINWISTFKGIDHEDWRYAKYRQENNRFVFEIINFFGLQMFPTVLVYIGLAPYLVLIIEGTNYFSLIGTAIIFWGTILEVFADHQVHEFLRTTTEMKTCQLGLWNYSRHPNYLGEISIWVGCAIPAIIQYPTYCYVYPGFILMFLLFYFISIPMMEKRQVKRRSDYTSYQKTTSKLFILPKRKLKNIEEQAD